MRRAHILKLNLKAEHPSQAIFFDTETESIRRPNGSAKLVLKLGTACYTSRHTGRDWSSGSWFEFDTPEFFWEWVDRHIKPKHKVYLFAHNLIFDMAVTNGFYLLHKLGWKLNKAIVDDPPTILNYRKGEAGLCLLDTFNWFHSSLEVLGESIGVPKLEMPKSVDSKEMWTEYCRQDVAVIKSAILGYLDFIKYNDLGNFQHTLASQAFTAYRHRFMRHKVLIDSNEKALDISRKAYFGGRTEAFFIGETRGDFYLLDVSSMYPSVMVGNLFPAVLKSVYTRVTLSELDTILKEHLVIGDVTLATPEPVFPLRHKPDLLFPVGKLRTVLATPELAYARDHNYITQIHKLALYHGEALFTGYVQALYTLKTKYQESHNQAYTYLCKLMLNSLYGKFGQTGRVYKEEWKTPSQEVKSWEEWDVPTQTLFKMRQFGGVVQSFRNEGESYNSSPAIAAHVTSYARVKLWNLILTAGREHVFYCDTDSLVVDKAGYDNLALFYIGDRLGDLKLIRKFMRLLIHGPKDYEFGDVKKIKGIRKNAVQTGPNTFVQDKFSHFRSMLVSGDLNTMIVTPVAKTLKRIYTKGEIGQDGRVIPLKFMVDDHGQTLPDILSVDWKHRGQFDKTL
jgi:hypothetical protein